MRSHYGNPLCRASTIDSVRLRRITLGVLVSQEYRWNDRAGAWLHFDGKRYRDAVLSADLNALRNPTPLTSHPVASPERRAKALEQAVETALMSGSTPYQRTEHSVVLGERRPVWHWWHILLCILTAGFWLIPYVIVVLTRGETRYRLEVDRWGHVWPIMR